MMNSERLVSLDWALSSAKSHIRDTSTATDSAVRFTGVIPALRLLRRQPTGIVHTIQVKTGG
jgi:hypothetical protein